jgi:uncharacterized protein (TIGR02145 family)
VLYNWEAAKKVCPAGWHLPTDEEWKQLKIYLGMSKADADAFGGSRETNEGGFKALPGGYFAYTGVTNGHVTMAHFWSATSADSEDTWNRVLNYINSISTRHNHSKAMGTSVRCVKD